MKYLRKHSISSNEDLKVSKHSFLRGITVGLLLLLVLAGVFTGILHSSLVKADSGVPTLRRPYTLSSQALNLAPSAIRDHPGSDAVVDDNLATEWIGGHGVPLGFVFRSPQNVQDIVVFDRAQSSSDNNQINKLQLVFDDGTTINNIDMTSGGPRCADVSFPAKQVKWINVVPTDSSGNNGLKEVQIWDTSGSVSSQNNCVMKYTITPTPGSGPSPLIQAPPSNICPTNWNCTDIGATGLTGGQLLSNTTWTVQGVGAGIGNTSDQFHYVWQPLAGDGTLNAQVLTQSNSDLGAKGGIMFRQDVSSGSAFYMVALTPGNGIVVQYRTIQGTNAQLKAKINGSAPVYLRATRTGNTFNAATSVNGVNWTAIAGSSATFTMGGAILAGLAVDSNNVSLASTVTFNKVNVKWLCPTGWKCIDIGKPNPSGGQSLSKGGTWIVQGAGGDIGGKADQFHYVWQPLAGDGSISTHILAQTYTADWAKAGVMIRRTTNPSSAFYAIALTPANGIVVQYRATNGANTTIVAQISSTVPTYLKATRVGNTITAYTSIDGINWTVIAGSATTVNWSGSLLAGLAVSSHAVSLCSVTFDTVKIS